MSDGTDGGFPRRDADGRISGVVDLLAVTLAGLLMGVAALAILDGAFALLGVGEFGRASGWLGLILPAWLFAEEFRAWRTVPVRTPVAVMATALGLALGLLAAGVAAGLPPLAAGGLGALVATVTYALVWFYGIRRLSGRTGEGER